MLAPSALLAMGHMRTVLVHEDGRRRDTLTFLYQLERGLATSSFACHCARACGVPRSVVRRAEQMLSEGPVARSAQDMEAEEEIARWFIGLDLAESGDRLLEQLRLKLE